VPEIYWLEADEDTEEHLAEHNVGLADLWEVIFNRYVEQHNPREGEDRFVVIGETNGCRIMTFSVAPTNDAGTWRPVTGWPADEDETKLFRRHAR
jgi:uncharacterized DUF497 family protein